MPNLSRYTETPHHNRRTCRPDPNLRSSFPGDASAEGNTSAKRFTSAVNRESLKYLRFQLEPSPLMITPHAGFVSVRWLLCLLKIIQKVFHDRKFLGSLSTTLVFNLLDLALGFPMPIILALMLNELRVHWFKKVSQTVLYLPHFLSWVIVGSVAYAMFRPNTGLVNMILVNAGWIDSGIPFLTEKWHWAVTYLLIYVWQTMGWGTIIYLAAITSINGELYEAAMIDGANRWQRMTNITLPGIRGTVVTMLIMNLGKIMGSNYERLDSLQNTQVRDFSYQLAIYIYEKGLQGAKFSEATVVGLFQSVIGLIMVIIADRIAKKLGEEGLL